VISVANLNSLVLLYTYDIATLSVELAEHKADDIPGRCRARDHVEVQFEDCDRLADRAPAKSISLSSSGSTTRLLAQAQPASDAVAADLARSLSI